MSKAEIVVLCSDTHCGHKAALWPPDFVTDGENPTRLPQSKFSEWLWACWEDWWLDYLPWKIGDAPYVLAINGDAIDGHHHGGKELYTTEEGDHLKGAALALEPATRRAQQVYLVEGTEVHTKQHEHALGVALGAVRNPVNGRAVFSELPLVVNDCLGYIRHHINATSRPYLEASQLSIHAGVERIEAARNDYRIPKWWARAHRHTVGYHSDARGLMCVTGAWQGHTRYTRKVVSAAIPVPCNLILDWRGLPSGSLPLVHVPRYYVPTEPDPIVV